MLIAKIHRTPFPDLIVGPFSSYEELQDWCIDLNINALYHEVATPEQFVDDPHRLWTHGTRLDKPNPQEDLE